MTLKLITPPAAEPLSLSEAKLHLRVDHSADDALITALIQAAREGAEHLTGRALITQTWERVLDCFPPHGIQLGRPPVTAVVSLKYLDGAGAEQTLSADAYKVDADTEPGRVVPAEGYTWPVTDDQPNAVRVRFTCGYGAAGTAVPKSILQWMLIQIGTMYKMRESVAVGVSVSEMPSRWVDNLLERYRLWGI